MVREISLEALRAFVAVQEAKGFNAAAKMLGYSQPKVTRKVQALEAWLGKILMTRDIPKRLTPDGEVFLQTARQVLAMLDDWRADPASVKPTAPISAQDPKVQTRDN